MTAPALDADAIARRLDAQLTHLAGLTSPGPGVTRLALSDEYMAALAYLTSIAEELHLQVSYDAVGNFYASNVQPDEMSTVLGSHVDSVPHGGRYDGTAGVLCAFEVARALPGLPVTVVSFIGEEGSRFPGGLLGSRCLAGELSAHDLAELRDEDGISYLDAARARGFDAGQVASCRDRLRTWSRYLEIHIEQGRVLQDEQLELGVVTDIVGMIQGSLTVTGRADHAGATPMHLRSDAGLTAAAVMLELERLARHDAGPAVGTVGRLDLLPGAHNVIPGTAVIGLDIRAPQEQGIDTILGGLQAYAAARAGERDQTVAYREDLRSQPVAMDHAIVDGLEAAARARGVTVRRMVSGAGHDAMIVAPDVPTGMLFVPCRDGISHSPDEFAEPTHLAQAVAVIVDFLSAHPTPSSALTPALEETP